jgi:RHH-type proline utilization regulon transcriptional repressor/proline dehydrogenase/delta 1-pyrroline-5-carboxylate dehydrogenase
VSEVREAVDFCRYYAHRAREDLVPREQPGPTGELNTFRREGRGPFLAISPWNFPLSIFVGQVAAALVAGNTVIAKPSELTNVIAHRAVSLAHAAGIDESVLCLLLCSGAALAPVLTDARLGGVVFTGSTATARRIQSTLASRTGPFVPLIAETGGINALIVDSSAQPEQVVRDVLVSSFESAGQRCSSLRVLFLQSDVADELLRLLRGALAELRIGHPCAIATDVPAVINDTAFRDIEEYVARFDAVTRTPLPRELAGHFVRPTLIELEGLAFPEREVFGPVLHVVRFDADQLDQVIAKIRESDFALTLGLHSRIEGRAHEIADRLPVGNFYVNRTIIGATVETQPFGGFKLSGIGPKAGGPDYLPAFCVERTVTINTAAIGGDAELLMKT